MESIRFENVWRILRNYNFEVNNEISCDLKCTICRKVMINACNSPCGCRFCSDCLKTYLNRTEKVCPGDSLYCKRVSINFDCNVFCDQPINHRIAQLRLKCPENCGDDLIELKQMEEHIRICNNQRRFCPFINIGCQENNLVVLNMKQHLLSEIEVHSNLIMQWNENMMNEVDSIKNQINEIKEKRNHNRRKNHFRIFPAFLVLVFCLVILNYANKISIVRTLLYNEENQISISKLKTKVEVNQSRNKYDGYQAEQEIYTANKSKPDMPQNELIWTIDNFSNKRENAKSGKVLEVFSEPFLSHENGYQLMVQVDPNGPRDFKDLYLSIFICIMKGSNDNNLPWPFKLNITFSIINQASNMVHYKKMLTYDMLPNSEEWNRPTQFRNIGVGFPGFIKLKELETEPGLIVGNKIVLKCNVHLDDKLTNTAQENGNKIRWTVKDFSQLRKAAQSGKGLDVTSKPFYSHINGYKIFLQLYPNGVNSGINEMLSVFFRVAKGPFDDKLEWPFKLNVVFELMNQHTNYPFFRAKFTDEMMPDHPNRNRPITEENLGFGFEKFISFEELLHNPGLIVDDKIALRVTTEIKKK